MNTTTRRWVIGPFVAALLIAVAGCAKNSLGPAQNGSGLAAISGSLREGPKIIGITASPDLIYTGQPIRPSVRTHRSGTIERTRKGFEKGAGVPILAGLYVANDVGTTIFALDGLALAPGVSMRVQPNLLTVLPVMAPVAVGMALYPAGATVGAIRGALSPGATVDLSPYEVDGAEDLFQGTLRGLKIEEAIRERIATVFAGTTGHRLVNLGHETFSYERVSYTGNDDSRRTLKARGIDAVLDIHVTSFGLTATVGDDPRAALRLKFRTLWFAEGLPFEHREWEYEGERRRLSAWAADDARLFRTELDRAVQTLADKIVAYVSPQGAA